MNLTDFERRALEGMSPIFEAEEPAYLQQAQNARVLDRENTGKGFYTRLYVDRSICKPVKFWRYRDTAVFHAEGVDDGVFILLWPAGSYLGTIEGYTVNADGHGKDNLEDLKYLGVESLDPFSEGSPGS